MVTVCDSTQDTCGLSEDTFDRMYAELAVSGRLITAREIRFSEIISALSVALDITQGHPQGHCMRSALVGMRLAEEIGLSQADCSALFYALLLKDLGCSSNAAKIAHLFHADDHRFKQSTRMIDWTKPGQSLRHCWSNCSPGSSLLERFLRMAVVMRKGPEAGRRISEIRCERGAQIARMLRLPDATARAIHDLDEHWDGRGAPAGLRGDEISRLGRICCLAQTVEVFFSAFGISSACEMARQRRGRWFDPDLVDALLSFQDDAAFWSRLRHDDLIGELSEWEPKDAVLIADEACLDRVAEAFAKVVDAKSPWTFDHSTRVAEIAVGLAERFDCSPQMRRDIRRAGLLHDIGKLGVSNLILDKPGKPTAEEFAEIRRHPEYSHRILSQVKAFRTLADVAAAHHERLDGKGYHLGLEGGSIHMVTRVLTVADIYEAMSARRPYRDAMQWEQIRPILEKDVGCGIDGECFEALRHWHDERALATRVEAQICAVERLLAEM